MGLFNHVYGMIIIFVGGIGSGKSLSIVREIVKSNQYAITNFDLKRIKGFHRIKVSDVITKEQDKKTKKEKVGVNWEYWDEVRKNNKSFSIYLDEVHNIISSRRAMSKTNITMSKWLSQIRKVTADSQNNHLYLITQTIRKIDVDFRELAQVIVHCNSIQTKKGLYIIQRWYDGLEAYEIGKVSFKTTFKGNDFFKYYNTEEMVKFGDVDEYL